jgi:twitching motility two-component system response regulator PilH
MLAEESTLIVDDNSDACRLMVILLGQLGERVTCRENGQKALEYLENHIPRLILLDVVMPDMSGIDVLKIIRKDPRLAAVPVVLFSSRTEDPSFAQYAKEQGAAEYWVKSEVLFSNLKQLLAPYLTRATVLPRNEVTPLLPKADDRKPRLN